jgi:hypothetical protein
MKRALETVNFIRAAKVIFLALGLIFGIALMIIGLTHTVTVGLFQKETQVLWGVVEFGAVLTGMASLVYVVLSWMEQSLLALVMIAGPVDAQKALDRLKSFDEHADQAMKLGYAADHTEA